MLSFSWCSNIAKLTVYNYHNPWHYFEVIDTDNGIAETAAQTVIFVLYPLDSATAFKVKFSRIFLSWFSFLNNVMQCFCLLLSGEMLVFSKHLFHFRHGNDIYLVDIV